MTVLSVFLFILQQTYINNQRRKPNLTPFKNGLNELLSVFSFLLQQTDSRNGCRATPPPFLIMKTNRISLRVLFSFFLLPAKDVYCCNELTDAHCKELR